nr:MAG: DNA pilot protein [Microvirus sp.]
MGLFDDIGLGDVFQGVGTIGEIAGGFNSAREGRQAQDRQMQFQQTMSDTAHQREVKDLRAAGLNPILSANKGADVPGGASMSVINPMAGASSAVQAARAQRNQDQMNASQTALNAMNAQNAGASAKQTQIMTPILKAKAGAEAANLVKDLQWKDKEKLMNMIQKGVGIGTDVMGAFGGGAAKAIKKGIEEFKIPETPKGQPGIKIRQPNTDGGKEL